MKTATLPAIRIEQETKDQASAILESIGLTTSAAVVLFLNQVITDKGLPFRPSTVPTYSQKSSFDGVLNSVMGRYDSALKELAK